MIQTKNASKTSSWATVSLVDFSAIPQILSENLIDAVQYEYSQWRREVESLLLQTLPSVAIGTGTACRTELTNRQDCNIYYRKK